jgi:hypothetical protein
MNDSNGMTVPQNMSECASTYARSLANPFVDYQACIPDYPALMTGRFHTFAKGTMSTSSAAAAGGFGFIVIDPSRGVANNAGAVMYSSAASTLTQINLTGGANLVSVNTNSPYASASFAAGNNQQYRVISVGLRIRYIGSELVRGGQWVGLHHPAHYSLHTYTIGIIDSYAESSRLPVTRDWASVVYHPVDTDDLDWANTFPVVTPAVTDPSCYMGFALQCPDTTGANVMSLEWEAHFNYEISGPLVQNKEVSHVDPVGHGAVNAVAMMSDPVRRPHNKPTAMVADGLVTAASHYISKHVSNPAKPPQHPAATSSAPSFWTSLLSIGEKVLPSILSAIL